MVERLEWTDYHTFVSYFQVISNVCHFVWPTALKLDYVTNFDMGFISLGDKFKFVPISNQVHNRCRHLKLPTNESSCHEQLYLIPAQALHLLTVVPQCYKPELMHLLVHLQIQIYYHYVLHKLKDAFGIEFPPVSTQLRLCNLLCKPLGSFLGPSLAVSHR